MSLVTRSIRYSRRTVLTMRAWKLANRSEFAGFSQTAARPRNRTTAAAAESQTGCSHQIGGRTMFCRANNAALRWTGTSICRSLARMAFWKAQCCSNHRAISGFCRANSTASTTCVSSASAVPGRYSRRISLASPRVMSLSFSGLAAAGSSATPVPSTAPNRARCGI